ncbi:MAG: DUF134 domain-containing protein [Lachnospiraceae bacterium]|nr:DUF134 domain-containing protein [Lachnospiraceae bacterium]
MPRPTKCRMICRFPQTLEFIPAKDGDEKEPVILTVDEYETIRLIDRDGLSQEQCSQRGAGYAYISRHSNLRRRDRRRGYSGGGFSDRNAHL